MTIVFSPMTSISFVCSLLFLPYILIEIFSIVSDFFLTGRVNCWDDFSSPSNFFAETYTTGSTFGLMSTFLISADYEDLLPPSSSESESDELGPN